MKNFLEKIFPVIREDRSKIYILCGLCLIFLLVYKKGEEEQAIFTTLTAILPLAMMQGVRDDYLRFAQRNDPENGRKTLPKFLIWAVLHTRLGFNAFISFLCFIFLFIHGILTKFSLIS